MSKPTDRPEAKAAQIRAELDRTLAACGIDPNPTERAALQRLFGVAAETPEAPPKRRRPLRCRLQRHGKWRHGSKGWSAVICDRCVHWSVGP